MMLYNCIADRLKIAAKLIIIIIIIIITTTHSF